MARIVGDRILDTVGLTPYFSLIFVTNSLIGVYYYRRQSLTASGAIASVLLGFVVFSALGIGGWLTLFLFFATSTIWSRISRRWSKAVTGLSKKGSCRDWMQVFANGGPAGISALLFFATGDPLFIIMFGAGVAEATSDTWASEIGVMSTRPPVLITTLRSTMPGLSGGVTILGTGAGLIGSLMIAGCWFVSFAGTIGRHRELYALGIAAAGFLGCLVDSILGATMQGHYWDTERNQLTEWEVRNGQRFALARGVRFLDNDMVNLASNCASLALIYVFFGE
jgi:uncharacterized protein (TIGR00297 family)